MWLFSNSHGLPKTSALAAEGEVSDDVLQALNDNVHQQGSISDSAVLEGQRATSSTPLTCAALHSYRDLLKGCPVGSQTEPDPQPTTMLQCVAVVKYRAEALTSCGIWLQDSVQPDLGDEQQHHPGFDALNDGAQLDVSKQPMDPGTCDGDRPKSEYEVEPQHSSREEASAGTSPAHEWQSTLQLLGSSALHGTGPWPALAVCGTTLAAAASVLVGLMYAARRRAEHRSPQLYEETEPAQLPSPPATPHAASTISSHGAAGNARTSLQGRQKREPHRAAMYVSAPC
jgi:hypothetical protein